jgi:hypothetical protein
MPRLSKEQKKEQEERHRKYALERIAKGHSTIVYNADGLRHDVVVAPESVVVVSVPTPKFGEPNPIASMDEILAIWESALVTELRKHITDLSEPNGDSFYGWLSKEINRVGKSIMFVFENVDNISEVPLYQTTYLKALMKTLLELRYVPKADYTLFIQKESLERYDPVGLYVLNFVDASKAIANREFL